MKTIEIERKFLVKNTDFLKGLTGERIIQGFLNKHPERTVRVRIKGKKAFLTVKGKSNKSGLSRFEWEKEIPVAEAEKLLLLCEPNLIEKIRYEVDFKGFIFEVDVFENELKGLVIAELELKDENQSYEKPAWLGEEVTGDQQYYNSYLSQISRW